MGEELPVLFLVTRITWIQLRDKKLKSDNGNIFLNDTKLISGMLYPTFQWYITKIQIYKKVLKYESLEAYLVHSSSLGPYHATPASFWNQETVQAIRMHTIMSKF